MVLYFLDLFKQTIHYFRNYWKHKSVSELNLHLIKPEPKTWVCMIDINSIKINFVQQDKLWAFNFVQDQLWAGTTLIKITFIKINVDQNHFHQDQCWSRSFHQDERWSRTNLIKINFIQDQHQLRPILFKINFVQDQLYSWSISIKINFEQDQF